MEVKATLAFAPLLLHVSFQVQSLLAVYVPAMPNVVEPDVPERARLAWRPWHAASGSGSGSGDDDRRHENVARKPLVVDWALWSLVNRISICCPPAMTAEGVVLPLRPWHAASGSGSGSCDDDRRHELDVLSPLSDNRR